MRFEKIIHLALFNGARLLLRPRQQAGPLNYFIYPYAEADGKPVETVKREFRFADLRQEPEGGATDTSR
jgi:hypothetical protein